MNTPAGGPACTVWLTGPSHSGQAALGRRLALALASLGRPVELIDGAEHAAAPETAAWAAGLLARHGVWSVVAAPSPDAARRREARRALGEFVEVALASTLEQRLNRAPAGTDPAALAAEPYQPPADPEVVLDMDRLGPEEALGRVLAYLAEAGLIGRPGEPAPPATGAGPAYTPEEEAQVRRRLEALGYL